VPIYSYHFATIGVANLFFFVIIVLVFAIDSRIVIWILIVVESACYLGILFVRRPQNKVICDIDTSGDCLLVSYHINLQKQYRQDYVVVLGLEITLGSSMLYTLCH